MRGACVAYRDPLLLRVVSVESMSCERCAGRRGHMAGEEGLGRLLAGADVPGESGRSSPPPPPGWLDRAKFRRGQAFFRKHFFGVYFAHLLSLLVALAWARSLRVLIHTQASHTPERAFRRYLTTLLHIKCWYEGDVWRQQQQSSKARNSIRTVRAVHRRVAQLANSQKEKVSQSTCTPSQHRSQLWPLVQKDLESTPPAFCPLAISPPSHNGGCYMSQLDMAVTQYEFVALVITCPHKLGIFGASTEDLEGFLHFWRGVGYLLGIQDRFNLCSGGLEETKRLCQDVTKHLILPNLREFSADAEHMSRALMEGTKRIVKRLSFESMLLYLCWCLGIRLPTFYEAMPWHYRCRYWLLRFVFGFLLRVPGVRNCLNGMLEREIQKAVQKMEQREAFAV